MPSIPVRLERAVELKLPGDFFSSLWMLCYFVLHVLRHSLHWNRCIKAMFSTVVFQQQRFIFLFDTDDFSFKIQFLKMLQNHCFSAWASRSGFGAAICVAVVRNSIVLCNSVSADLSGMVAPRFLAAAGACGIPLSCGAQRRKSYCSGCMMVANGAFGKGSSAFWRGRFFLCKLLCEAVCCVQKLASCGPGMFVRNLSGFSGGSMQLFCSRSCWHV